MNDLKVRYVQGLPEEYRRSAARLYDGAFGKKFATVVAPRERRIKLLSRCLILEFAVGATTDNGLVGLAGYHLPSGSLTGGMNYKTLISNLGLLRGSWAAIVFSLYDRKPQPGELLMDGIAVDERVRGRGVGTGLLNRLVDYASEQGLESIRLDVIDTNPGARRLYERNGFAVVKTERFESLRGFLGFGASSTMIRTLQHPASAGAAAGCAGRPN